MKRITNPNFIYIATFLVPFLVYTLEWSTIYPGITSELLTFYIITFSIAFTLGILISYLPGFKYHPIPVYPYNRIVVISLFIFFAIDCLYEGFVPLFDFSGGVKEYAREDFGIPVLHLIIVSFSSFFALFLFHQYISNRKWSLLIQFLLTFVPFVFLMQRSSIMQNIIGSAFLFFISLKNISLKKILIVALFGLGSIYLFGYLGNIRSAGGDPTFIPRASGATKEFLESKVPKELYWGYLYISSPLANAQNNINFEKNVDPDYLSFIVFEMTPHAISKKLAQIFPVTERSFNQINAFLNVGTIYAKAFSYLSWLGMFIMFVYIMFLMNLYYSIIIKSYLFSASGVSLMFTIIALGNFENSLQNTQFSFPLFYPFIFSIFRGVIIQHKNKATPLNSSNRKICT